MNYCAGKLIENLSYFIKAIGHTFYGFTSVVTHLDAERALEKLVNHSPSARDLQASLVFS